MSCERELTEATRVSRRRGESEQQFLVRLTRAVNDLSDEAWEKLGIEAQDWYNAAADCINKGKEIQGFKNSENPVKVEPRSTSPQPQPKADSARSDTQAKVGDTVLITDKRGVEVQGVVRAISSQKVVVQEEGEEELETIACGDIKSIRVLDGPRDAPSSVTPKTGPGQRERTPTPASSGKPVQRSTDQAVQTKSATQRIREVVCKNPEVTKEQILQTLSKEGIEAKASTVELLRADTLKTIECLRALKKLKE